MWLIKLAISLFSILKVNTLECLSVINRKCMPRPKMHNANEVVGEALFYPCHVLVNKVGIRSMILWQEHVFLISLKT